ncbi:MAG: hypothetical protein ACTTKY_02675 [Catonella sp.]
MGEYAFYFKHNLFDEEESKGVDEYFVPYVPKVLIEVVEDEYLKAQLENSEWNSFDEYVEAHNLQEREYIRLIPDNRTPDVVRWVNDENNIDELCAWDYLADAKAIIEAERANGESTERVNSVAEATMISRIAFGYLKVLLSIMVYTDGLDPDGILNGNEPPNDFGPETQEKIIEIYNIINNIDLSGIHFDKIEFEIRDYIRKIDNIVSGVEKNEIFGFVNKIKEELEEGLSIKTPNEYENYQHNLYKLKMISNFFELLGEKYEKRYKYIDIRYRNYYYLYGSRWFSNIRRELFTSDEETLELCLDKGKFKNYINDINSLIAMEVVGHWNRYNSLLDGNPNYCIRFARYFDEISHILNGKVGKKLYNRYTSKGDGCFAILVTSKNNKYFALSGAYEIHNDNNKREQIEHLVDYIKQNVFNNCNVSYIWAKLNDNTLRYTEILDEMSKQTDKYIKFPFRYCNDKKITIQNPGLTYGCCERKIFGYLETDTIKGIYSRWAPCWKCKPAVIVASPEKFYAFAKDFNEWKNKGKTMQLKNYIINKPITFLIDE